MRRHDQLGCALNRDSGLGTLCAVLSKRLQKSVIGSVPQCRIFFLPCLPQRCIFVHANILT